MSDEQPLLQLSEDQHKISIANSTQPDYALRTGPCRASVRYQPQMKEGLVNLGLYQMTQVNDCLIDKALITALVERWRPETNTFHLPVGECTVTLEDVSCLWGLPVTGKAIAGRTDDNWSLLIEDCLGHEVYDGNEDGGDRFFHSQWHNKGKVDEHYRISKYYMRLRWLKDHFNGEVTQYTPQETVDRHTRAYCMDLFGSVMFPDANSSSVPIMYLQFLENLGPRDEDYNWGGAVLACLYRELSRASRAAAQTINGPLLLLQMWSWTRFPIGRPRPKSDLPFGGENLSERMAFGAKWTIPHTFDGNPIRGTLQYRSQFERLRADVVNWMPYVSYVLHHQPWRGERDQGIFICRVWLVHFWELEVHCPERVLRQFGLFQAVPPPAPPEFGYMETIRRWTRALGLFDDGVSADWSTHWSEYTAQEPFSFALSGPYDVDSYPEYIQWFFSKGMPSLYPIHNNEQILSQPVPAAIGEVGDLGYVSDGLVQARIRFRQVNTTARGIAMVKTPGQKAFGLIMLENSRDTLSDIGHIGLFRAMVERAGLPFDISRIDISDDIPDLRARDVAVEVPPPVHSDVMQGIYTSIDAITIDGVRLGDDASPSEPARPRRKKKGLLKFSHSRFADPRGRENMD